MDWDEELKRQAAISALLAPPEDGQTYDTKTDEQVVAPEDTTDYHKLVSSSFDHPNISPPPPLDIPKPTPESPTGPADIKTDEDTGTRYVIDSDTNRPVPHAELATPADKAAFPPSDVTLPKTTVEGQAVAPRAQLIDPDPDKNYLELEAADKAANVPGFVAGSQNAILNPAAGVTPPPKYADQIVTPDEASGKTSIVNAPASVTTVTPPPASGTTVPPTPTKSDWDSLVNSAWPSAKEKEPPAVAAGDVPAMMNAPNGQAPVALIIHHTGGNNSADSVVNDWSTNRPGVGAQMIMDRDGVIHETKKEFGYGGTGNFLHSVVPGVNNSTAVGIEVIAKDDADMTDAQLESLKRLAGPKGPYANVPVYGHSQVSPGDRENEGVRGVNAINDGRAGGTTDVASTIDSSLGGLLANKGAVYAEMGAKYGVDPKLLAAISILETGHGTSHILQTRNNVAGLGGGSTAFNSIDESIEAEAKNLRQNYIDQGLTSIGDIGAKWAPPGAENDAGGNKDWPATVAQLYAKMGGSGQLDTTAKTATAGQEKQPWDDWVKLSPEDQAKAETAGATRAQTILNDLQAKSPNLPAFMNALQKPIEGVPEYMRQAVANKTKADLTKYAQEYYQEKDPNKAYDRIMSSPNLATFGGEILSKLGPNFQHAWLSLASQATSASPLMQFINVAQPDASPEARTNLVKQVMAQSGDDRTHFIKALYSHLSPDQAQNVDLNALLNWSDTVSQPGVQAEQARQQDYIKSAVAQNQKNLREDPTMAGTYGGTIANAIAQFPKNVAEGLIPVIGQSAMFSEIYTDTLDGLRKDHPTWTEDQLKARAAASSIPQDLLQELINVGTLGLGGGALRSIENPVARLVTSSILHGTVTAAAGTTQQAVSNVATGRPWNEGLLQAGESAGIQGLIGGAIGARHGKEVEPVRVEEPEVHPTEPAAPVTPPPRPVTTNEVLGPDVPPEPTPPRPWYMQGAEPGQDPLVIRGAERTTWTPQELSDAIQRLPAGTPEELRSVLESLAPTSVHLGDEGDVETEQTRQMQARMQAEERQPGPPPPRPGNISGEDPYVSREAQKTTLNGVANVYQQARTAAGELLPVDPNVGVTTEELLARGARMSPDEINRHVNDLMQGKVSSPRDMAAAVRAKERELTQRSRQLGIQSEENPSNVQLKQEADTALKILNDFHSLGGPIQKMKEIFNHIGVGLQGDLQYDLSSANGLKEKFSKERGGKLPPPSADPMINDTAQRVRKAHSVEYTAKSKLSTEVDRWTRGKMTDEKIEEMRQAALRKMNMVAC